ncbi:MAG: oligopeptide/dipeptide ABC transporter ATP-binding protein [Candidatus Onthomonas sp.]|nr:oligopeptide/dipeptide ABC transporter ATP-binding protein [Candidatus Onthomonas sp.]
MKERKTLLSLRNVEVKFNVRGRILTAIRNVSLDIYEHESLAIVGESGSGKSVLTKTFAGMLDSNGFIPQGTIIFSDDEISETTIKLTRQNRRIFNYALNMLNKNSRLERGAREYNAILAKQEEIRCARGLTAEEEADFDRRIKEAGDNAVDQTNYLWTLDKKADAEEYAQVSERIKSYNAKKTELEAEKAALEKQRTADYQSDAARIAQDKAAIEELKVKRKAKIDAADVERNPFGLTDQVLERNKVIAYEVILSIGRYPLKDQLRFLPKLNKAFKQAMSRGQDMKDPAVLNKIFESVAFRVEFRSYDEANETLHGYAIIDCAKVKYTKDWQQIRGCRIATVFQDPMTSLNPVITIGKQIMTVILKHQKCSAAEAKRRTLDIMAKVGIPEPEKRFDDYPFEYSGGMRQRIVIAIALSCQPKILICDEPTTALDVTIQAQILRLIKDLQKELGFTTVYITHDLGVVANVAERVAVLYGGQIVELGTVEDIFYDPKHPYTWALLSSLPQLCEKGTDLFSIPGTPPSLYNKIVGDAFAPRNKYALAIDLVEEPPMFQVSETHYAKTWLLDPRAPKTEAPKNIQNLHEKIKKTYIEFTE